jgi:hypothetical protein
VGKQSIVYHSMYVAVSVSERIAWSSKSVVVDMELRTVLC